MLGKGELGFGSPDCQTCTCPACSPTPRCSNIFRYPGMRYTTLKPLHLSQKHVLQLQLKETSFETYIRIFLTFSNLFDEVTSALSRLRRGEDVPELQPLVSCCQQHETHPEAPCAGAGGVKEAPAPGAGLVSERLPSPFSSPTPQCPAVGSQGGQSC